MEASPELKATNHKGGTMTEYELPPAFYLDHVSRDLPEQGYSVIVRKTRSKVWVRMDRPAYDDLLSDARHYAGGGASGFGPELRGLAASAKATVRALSAAGRPNQPKEA